MIFFFFFPIFISTCSFIHPCLIWYIFLLFSFHPPYISTFFYTSCGSYKAQARRKGWWRWRRKCDIHTLTLLTHSLCSIFCCIPRVQEDDHFARPEVRIVIPDELKQKLVEDWDQIIHKNKVRAGISEVVAIAASPSLADPLQSALVFFHILTLSLSLSYTHTHTLSLFLSFFLLFFLSLAGHPSSSTDCN